MRTTLNIDEAALSRASELTGVKEKTALRVPDNVSVYAALDICRSENVNLLSIAPRRETLEELFVRVVGDAERATRAS